VIREWRLDRTSGRAELADLEALLGPRTRLVACTHASNILGTLMPIGAIAERAHAAGAQLCVDGVAYAPHRAIDVRALGADYYVFSLYKTYGPHHAVLYGRHDRLLAARNINHWFYGEERLPAKLEPGNPNYELAWGSTAIVDYLIGLGTGDGERARIEDAFARIAAHEEALSDRLLGFLKSRNGVRVVGETTADRTVRVPTISFVADDKRAEAIVTAVDPHGIGIRFGDFHSKRLIESLGLAPQGGVVRVSMVHYNTIEEVDRLCAVLDRLL
jgi:selenocysteine lyase/cysteine desulfurase